jgi:MFS family permease
MSTMVSLRQETTMQEKINIRTMLGGGFLVLLVAMGIGRFAYTPLLPPMMSEYVFGAEEAGFLASSNYLGYLVGAFTAGALCRVWGEKRLLLFGLFLSVLTTAGTGFSVYYPLVTLMRLLAGVASAFCFVAMSRAWC